MNHIYENIHGWFTFPSFYSEIVKQSKDGYHIIEVGVWKGKSAAYMAVEIINSGKRIRFDCVDTWDGSIECKDESLMKVKDGLYNCFLDNIKPVHQAINIVRMSSYDAAKTYNENSVNYIFIDASHDYDNVCADIKAWLPKVRCGGILAGHDFKHPPVRKALQDVLNDKVISTHEDIWIYHKR